MNIDQAWLSDEAMAQISYGPVDPQMRASIWRGRYVDDCPSECYRGAATMLSLLVEEMDQSLNASSLPADNNVRVGAFLTLANIASYAQTEPNINLLYPFLQAELICTAQFFFQNRQKGI